MFTALLRAAYISPSGNFVPWALLIVRQPIVRMHEYLSSHDSKVTNWVQNIVILSGAVRAGATNRHEWVAAWPIISYVPEYPRMWEQPSDKASTLWPGCPLGGAGWRGTELGTTWKAYLRPGGGYRKGTSNKCDIGRFSRHTGGCLANHHSRDATP
jgi:hypothetical protein